MVSGTILATGAIIALAGQVSAHISIWHPSMFGFNKSDTPRPQDPLINLPFNQWWFHGHLGLPPHSADIMQLPVGGSVDTELSCDKGATSFYSSAPGGDTRDPGNPDYPCPGQPTSQFHTNGINDLGGCALGVAYKSDVTQIVPEDFTIFSVNQTCVWTLHTSFSIPQQMPKCPDDKCICAWFWIHKADSGSEQMYMTGFQCNMQGAVSTTPLPPAQVARRCGVDPDLGLPANPSNCTYGPKQPLYWYQAERNNMFEGTYTPPLYNDLYHFLDGAQNDIFQPGNSSTQPAVGTNSPVPLKTPLVPSPSPPASSSPSPSSSSSSPPAPPPSSSPAGGTSTPHTSSTHSSHSSKHTHKPSPTHTHTSKHTHTQEPKHTHEPEHTHKPKHTSCSHDPHHPKPSGARHCVESPPKDHSPRANPPAPRQHSPAGDAPVIRRVWGHRRRSVDRRNA